MHVVIDTNVILDMFVYTDPRAQALLGALNLGELQWLATRVMREELARVLRYPHIQKRMVGLAQGESAPSPAMSLSEAWERLILESMDARVTYVQVASRASYVCKDVDDQKFIDLAQAHQSLLISKDKAVLSMKNRMAKVGVQITSVYTQAAMPA